MAFLLFSCLLKFVLCRLSLQAGRTSKTYGHRYGPMEIQWRQQSNWISPIPVSASSCFLDFFFVFGMNPPTLRPRRNCSVCSEICWTRLTCWIGVVISCLCARGGHTVLRCSDIVTCSWAATWGMSSKEIAKYHNTIYGTPRSKPSQTPAKTSGCMCNLDPEHVQKHQNSCIRCHDLKTRWPTAVSGGRVCAKPARVSRS